MALQLSVVLVIERMEFSIDLFDLNSDRGALPEYMTCNFFHQRGRGCFYSHRAGIFHGDVKNEKKILVGNR